MAKLANHEALKPIIIDYFALRLADDLGAYKLPPDQLFDQYRGHVEDKAELILLNYEKDLQVDSISSAVVDRLRDNLVRRTRVSDILEVATNVSALVIGALAGCVAMFLDPASNVQAIRAVCFGITGVMLLQFLGNSYLKYFDQSR